MTDVRLDKEPIGSSSSSHLENMELVSLEPVDLFKSESTKAKIVRNIKIAWSRRKNDIDELKQLARIALPLSVTYIAQFLITTTNLFFVGKRGTKEELAGAAFGYTYCNVFGFALGIGMMSAQDTLCSQAFGAGNFKRVGVILQRTIIIVMLMCIPLSFIWGFSEQILIALHQDPIVSAKAGQFIRAMIPSLPAYMFFEAVKRWLQMQSVVMPLLYIVLIVAAANVFITWLFVDGLALGYIGAPIAVVVTYYLAIAVQLGYVFWKKLHVQTWPGFSKEAWKEWPTYLYYGSFGMVMICAEWWGFEIHTLLAGLMGTVPVASQTVILNTMQLIFMIPLGVQIAVTTRVGNSLGAGDAQGAKTSAKMATITIIISQCIIALGFFIARNSWGWVFTNEEEVVQTVAATLPIACCFMFADGGQGVMSGALRGIGKQKIGGITNLIGYYVLGIPLAYLFGFHLELGIRGLWLGLLTSSLTCFVVFVIVLVRADWEHEAMLAQQRSKLEDAGLHVPVTTDPSLMSVVEEGKSSSSPPSSPVSERNGQSNGHRL